VQEVFPVTIGEHGLKVQLRFGIKLQPLVNLLFKRTVPAVSPEHLWDPTPNIFKQLRPKWESGWLRKACT
jgi:hypothetical protein